MIICSCTQVTERHIETALIEILSQPDALMPTPGVVFRHLSQKMICCGCAPLAVDTICRLVDELEQSGRVCPYACATAKAKLILLDQKRREREPYRASSPAFIAAA
ncbi:MAG: hypothetical protein ABL901_15770 [Hyphomicrobiaceae bacterium]